tara:strand:+ start:1559 stop:4480 length:2922 start_codon:yes stop_codon:yes gene_type:complete
MQNNQSKKPTLLLVDGHSLAFRSFYAFAKGPQGGLTTKEGLPTSVTYGFLKSLLDNCMTLSPQGVCIAFDTSEPTFRHKLDPNYKANREVAPPIFFQDVEQLRKILEKDLNLPIYISPGFEADDILGTLAHDAARNGWQVKILSGDRDLFQLVNDDLGINVLYMGGGPYAKSGNPLLIDEDGVKTKLGVTPDKVIQLKALTGDNSDNIPGVKGVGPKTALNLLKENLDLDGIYNKLNSINNNYNGFIKGSLIEKLKRGEKNAYKSLKLAEIKIDIPIKNKVSYLLSEVNLKGLEESLKALELTTLIRQLDNFLATFSSGGYLLNKDRSEKIETLDSKISQTNNLELPNIQPKIILTELQLEELIKILKDKSDKGEVICIDTETTSLNIFEAELIGLGFCWGEGLDQMAYIPFGHKLNKKENNIDNQISIELFFNRFVSWFKDETIKKVLQNTKFDRLILLQYGIELKGVVFDTLLADYILNTNEKHSLEAIANREFNFKPNSFKEIIGDNKDFSFVDINTASKYCGMDVFLTRKIYLRLKDSFKSSDKELLEIYNKIELPLEKVLSQIELNGIRIDTEYLSLLSKELNASINNLEKDCFKIVNKEFNLSSPKQLGELLFNELKLDTKKSRKTKNGWSTDVMVLEKLEKDHPIISKLIEYRSLSKLLSTYVDALPLLIQKSTGRIHTNFNQAVTSTGRLSSSNPNLQNIPIRTESSKRIRKAFLPQKGWKLICADYSQIELRILAHLSEEDILLEAYKNNEDIHALTAKILFEKENITQSERRIGKTINFGVIYGMGALKLSKSMGIEYSLAKEFLLKYKSKYSKMFAYLELQQKLVLSKGYVKTIFGRRRNFLFDKNGLGRFLGKPLDEIDLKLAWKAGFEAKQLLAAGNAPIQGSSADIIKIAMIEIHNKIFNLNIPARLLLQVHDELVLEVEPSALLELKNIVKSSMENAVKLKVPLSVDIGIGDNWLDAK